MFPHAQILDAHGPLGPKGPRVTCSGEQGLSREGYGVGRGRRSGGAWHAKLRRALRPIAKPEKGNGMRPHGRSSPRRRAACSTCCWRNSRLSNLLILGIRREAQTVPPVSWLGAIGRIGGMGSGFSSSKPASEPAPSGGDSADGNDHHSRQLPAHPPARICRPAALARAGCALAGSAENLTCWRRVWWLLLQKKYSFPAVVKHSTTVRERASSRGRVGRRDAQHDRATRGGGLPPRVRSGARRRDGASPVSAREQQRCSSPRVGDGGGRARGGGERVFVQGEQATPAP